MAYLQRERARSNRQGKRVPSSLSSRRRAIPSSSKSYSTSPCGWRTRSCLYTCLRVPAIISGQPSVWTKAVRGAYRHSKFNRGEEVKVGESSMIYESKRGYLPPWPMAQSQVGSKVSCCSLGCYVRRSSRRSWQYARIRQIVLASSHRRGGRASEMHD